MIGFWFFMLICDLLIPLVMIGFGRLFMKKAPAEINWAFGYRTTMSMKNRDTWEFAHKYIGKLWFFLGLILLVLSVIPLLFVLDRDVEAVGMVGIVVCFAQLVPMVGSIIPTEIALKRNFDSNGRKRKQKT